MKNENQKNYIGTISNIEPICIDCFKLDIISELKTAISGQFVSVLCPNKTLRRPFSIADFEKLNENESKISILIKLKGEGTNYLKNLKIGEKVNFLAPLGNGFSIKNKKSLLVGAGIGIAPMLLLKKELNERGIENYLISGFNAKEQVINGSDKTVVGNSVLDNLEELVDKEKFEIIYSCGPKVVLDNISKLATRKQIDSQLALEKVMACSIGVCRGCVIRLMTDNGEKTASVCKDGPVFLGSEIIWD